MNNRRRMPQPRKELNTDLQTTQPAYEPFKDHSPPSYEPFSKDFELPVYKQDSLDPPKYQSGAVAQAKTNAQPSPSLKPNRLEKAKRRLGEGAVNESQTFNNPYNNFSYENQTRKPAVSSKMETYETKD